MTNIKDQLYNRGDQANAEIKAVINNYEQLYGDAQFDAALSVLLQPLSQRECGSYSADALEWLNNYEPMIKLLQPLTKLPPAAHISIEHQALLFYYLGLAFHRLGQQQAATEYINKALQLARNLKDNYLQIKALYEVAGAYLGQHQYEQAIEVYQQILALAQQVNDVEEMAWSLDRIALVYCYELGDVQRGIAYFEQALRVVEQSGDKALVSMYWSELGAAYAQAQQYDQALECYEQALDLARLAGDKTREGSSLADLGSAYKAQGKLDEAIAFYQQAFDLFAQIDNKEAASLTADDLAGVYSALGDEEKAAYYRNREAEYDAILFA